MFTATFGHGDKIKKQTVLMILFLTWSYKVRIADVSLPSFTFNKPTMIHLQRVPHTVFCPKILSLIYRPIYVRLVCFIHFCGKGLTVGGVYKCFLGLRVTVRVKKSALMICFGLFIAVLNRPIYNNCMCK